MLRKVLRAKATLATRLRVLLAGTPRLVPLLSPTSARGRGERCGPVSAGNREHRPSVGTARCTYETTETSMAKLSAGERDALPDSAFASPKQRKEPIPDRGHVLAAIRLFTQVEDVTEQERDEAWKRIKAAAKRFGVDMEHEDWRELK